MSDSQQQVQIVKKVLHSLSDEGAIFDTLSRFTQAEIAGFLTNRNGADMVVSYIDARLEYHEECVERLQHARTQIEEAMSEEDQHAPI